MRGTMLYDVIIMIGAVLIVALLILWAVQYGSGLVSDAMLQSPSVVQAALSSDLSIACGTTGNITIDWKIPQPYTMTIRYNATHVQVRPARNKYYYSDVERGGYLGYGIEPPIVWAGCGLNVIERGVPFDETKNKEVILVKEGDDMRVRVS